MTANPVAIQESSQPSNIERFALALHLSASSSFNDVLEAVYLKILKLANRCMQPIGLHDVDSFDVAHDAWIKIRELLLLQVPERLIRSPLSYMGAVVWNTGIDFRRRKRQSRIITRPFFDEDEERFLEKIPDPHPTPEELTIAKIGEDLLFQKARQVLSRKEWVIIHARYWEDRSIRDVAQCFNMPLGTVRSRGSRACKKLGKVLRAN